MLSWLSSGPAGTASRPRDESDPALQPPPNMLSPEERSRRASQRISFGRRGATATGWPSTGGILLMSVNTVDLQHLDVSRIEPTPSSEPCNQQAEDAWCRRLRQLSARWIPSFRDWDHATAGGRPLTALEQQSVFVAWPSSGHGVWIFTCQTERLPSDFGVYNMCLTMDERCHVLETFGAQYYANPDQCPELDERLSDQYKKQRQELDWDEHKAT